VVILEASLVETLRQRDLRFESRNNARIGASDSQKSVIDAIFYLFAWSILPSIFIFPAMLAV
jgi:hypothetical protein